MRTFITNIYGGGAPTYLISAENEERAWTLIKEAMSILYGNRNHFNPKIDCNGLIEIKHWTSNQERIDNIHGMYSNGGMMKKGSYKGL